MEVNCPGLQYKYRINDLYWGDSAALVGSQRPMNPVDMPREKPWGLVFHQRDTAPLFDPRSLSLRPEEREKSPPAEGGGEDRTPD